MGNSCCHTESPCGSTEERSVLLKNDSKATVPTVETVVEGSCGPDGGDDMRKPHDEADINVEEKAEAVQVKQRAENGETEPKNTQENGPLKKESIQSAMPCLSKGFTLKENSPSAQDEDKEESVGDNEQAELLNFPLNSQQKAHTAADWEVFTERKEVPEEENPASLRDKVPGGILLTAESVLHEKPLLTDTISATEHIALSTSHDDREETGSKVSFDNAVTEPSEFSQNSQVLSLPNTKLEAAAYEVISISVVSQETDKEAPSCSVTEDSDTGSSLLCKQAGPEDIKSHEYSESSPASEPKGLDHSGEEQDSAKSVRESETTAPADATESEEDLYRGAEEMSVSQHSKPGAPSVFKTTFLKVEDRCSLAKAVDILFYSEREWKGNTAKSALIRKGYEEMSQKFGSLRRVRGDNYCALRATLFQVLSHCTQLPAWLQDEDTAMLLKKLEAQEGLVKQWKFPGECLQRDGTGDVTQQLKSYMELLRSEWQAAVDCSSAVERQQLCERVFQGGEEELGLLEALKLLMLGRAVELHSCMQGGQDVPLFCWLLFARDSSACPRAFLSNHLSHVGLSAGLEQVEMFLLGYALQFTIQVYRLYKTDTEEFVTYYPDDHKDDWPSVCLVTEDDRHYNVPVVEAAELHQELNSS
ncbi:Hypothetical protein SMAX5B_004612 [Scophthalmus maximus]|uniref:Ubiquitin thioesterase otulin-like n=1 Tax=Scophthalmus maximus TaxID=52904 RepID=A0A2U9CLL3_SCOMX|nr:Hypothetical protein SMAX5B_004612 [Scophthalmus maximus]